LMDYLSGNLSGEQLHDVERSMADNEFLNDAVEGLQQLGNRKSIQTYVDQLNATLKKSMAKKKQRRLNRRLKDDTWTYLTVGIVIFLCLVAYWIVRLLLKK
jgi:hypothetical protein